MKKCFSDLGFAKLDLEREKRKGFAEVIYCPGKTRKHLLEISLKLYRAKQDLLLTRLEKKDFLYLKKFLPLLKYSSLAKLGFIIAKPKKLREGFVAVVSAGTADLPIAEEAAVTLEVMGSRVERFFDCGVAGVHRLMYHIDKLRAAKVIVVVAGMEGALASLVSGLVKAPIVAVPTSVGYGANFAGLAALLTMLNSCSPGISVVNIDNGFGAGYFASLINNK